MEHLCKKNFAYVCLFMFYLVLGQRLEHLMVMILIPKCPPKTTTLVDHDQAALPLVFTTVIPLSVLSSSRHSSICLHPAISPFVRPNKQGREYEPQGIWMNPAEALVFKMTYCCPHCISCFKSYLHFSLHCMEWNEPSSHFLISNFPAKVQCC